MYFCVVLNQGKAEVKVQTKAKVETETEAKVETLVSLQVRVLEWYEDVCNNVLYSWCCWAVPTAFAPVCCCCWF